MMTWFLGNEMTLKTTLLVWEPMVRSNALVTWVIGLDEKLQPLMTSIDINVFFSIRSNLYCYTNSLSMKQVDVPESISVWASIVISLLHLTMIGENLHEPMNMSVSLWTWTRENILKYILTMSQEYSLIDISNVAKYVFDNISIFCHVSKIFEYFTTSFNYMSLSSWNKSNHYNHFQGNQV